MAALGEWGERRESISGAVDLPMVAPPLLAAADATDEDAPPPGPPKKTKAKLKVAIGRGRGGSGPVRRAEEAEGLREWCGECGSGIRPETGGAVGTYRLRCSNKACRKWWGLVDRKRWMVCVCSRPCFCTLRSATLSFQEQSNYVPKRMKDIHLLRAGTSGSSGNSSPRRRTAAGGSPKGS